MAQSLSSIVDLLKPGLLEIEGTYEDMPQKVEKIFTKRKGTLAVEMAVSMRLLTLPQLKQEGAATQFDNNAGQRFRWNMEPDEVSLGFSVTRRAIINNLYKSQFNPTALNLLTVFKQYKEIAGTNILNNATTYNTALGGDGVSLCSTAHPNDGGTWANRFTTDLDLNEASLLQAMENIRYFPDEANLRVMAEARRLIVPIRQEKIAVRLTKTEMRPGTSNNDVNAIKYTAGGLPDGYQVLDFLSSDYAWYLQTSIPGLIYIEREPFETSMWVDDVTDNLLVKGYEYYGFFFDNPRNIYGSFPTA